MVTVGMLSTSPRMWSPLFRVCPAFPLNLDVIVVRKEGANQSHRDFRVRCAVVHRALQWLVTHNQYYHSLANNLYQPRTSVKLYSSSVDTPFKLLE